MHRFRSSRTDNNFQTPIEPVIWRFFIKQFNPALLLKLWKRSLKNEKQKKVLSDEKTEESTKGIVLLLPEGS